MQFQAETIALIVRKSNILILLLYYDAHQGVISEILWREMHISRQMPM